MKKESNNSENILNIRTTPQVAYSVRESIMLILHGFYYITQNEKNKSWIDLDKVSFVDMICANFDENEIKNLFDFLQSIDLELDNNDKVFLEKLENCFSKNKNENKIEKSNKTKKLQETKNQENIIFIDFKEKKN